MVPGELTVHTPPKTYMRVLSNDVSMHVTMYFLAVSRAHTIMTSFVFHPVYHLGRAQDGHNNY